MADKLTREEARVKIIEWVNALESADPDAKGFDDAIEELIVPVKNGRLDYNAEDDTFNLVLLSPIGGADGASAKDKIEIVTFHEISSDEYKVIQRFKDEEKIEKNQALIAKSCGLALGDVARMKSRDLTVAGTIITVFFS